MIRDGWTQPCPRSLREVLLPYILLGLGRLGVPDLDVVEQAILALAAEFDPGLGGMRDAGGLEEAYGLAVQRGAHFVADCFNDGGVPLVRGNFRGEGGATSLQQEWLEFQPPGLFLPSL